jgi:hypothetical protein
MSFGILTIANAATTSDSLSVRGSSSGVCIELPSAMTGTTIAIHGSIDGTNFKPIYNDGVLLSLTYVASSIHVLSPTKLYGIEMIRLVSGSSEGAARTFNVTALRV